MDGQDINRDEVSGVDEAENEFGGAMTVVVVVMVVVSDRSKVS